ncbi:MAG TPA: hypothetical protein VF244_08190, partial [Acidimicrobiales bacterium]
MFPSIPADLSTLSDEQLTALLAEVEAWVAANAAGEGSPEQLSAMADAVAAHGRLVAERDSRAAAEAPAPAATLAELAARITPPAPPAAVPNNVTSITSAPSFSAEDLTALGSAIGAAVAAALPTPQTMTLEQTEHLAAELVLPPLSALRTAPAVQEPTTPEPLAIQHVMTAAADIPAVPASGDSPAIPALTAGAVLMDMDAIGRAFHSRRVNLGPGGDFDRVPVASVRAIYPESRILRAGATADNYDKIRAVAGRQALMAAGGPCVPVQPYNDLIVFAGAQRPVRDMLSGFQADAMGNGIAFLASPDLTSPGAQARVVTDGVTATNTTVTSATANFQAAGVGGVGGDIGASISGTGIPPGAKIVAVGSATSVTISAAATATAAGVTLTITRLGAIGFITSAQDTAALGAGAGTLAQVAGLKPCIHVSCPAPTTVLLDAITWCLEFGNWTTRAFPQQMPAWLQLTLALWARTAEVNLLDKMSAA